MQQVDEAISQYLKGLEFARQEGQIHLQLGLIYQERGDRVAALTHLQAAVQLLPNSEGARNALRNLQEQKPPPPPSGAGQDAAPK